MRHVEARDTASGEEEAGLRLGSDDLATCGSLALLLIAAVGSTPLPKELWRRLEGRLSAHPIPLGAMETCLVAAGMVLSIAFLVDASYNPFLYFRF